MMKSVYIFFLLCFSSSAWSICRPGQYRRNDECEFCPKGTFQDRSGQSICFNCPSGYYSTMMGSINCQPCPKGHWCNKNDKRKPPIPCPKGKQQHETGKSFCWDCRAGYYSDQIGSLYCKICPKGHWCDKSDKGKPPVPCPKGTQQHEAGKSACWDCRKGYYSDQIGSFFCKACPKGHWCDNSNKGKPPIPCAKGTEQSQTEKNICWPCKKGYYSDQIGSRYCKICPKGHWCDNSDKGKPPVPCPKGTQQHQTGKNVCWPCKKGYHSDQIGSLYCKICPKGHWCDENNKGKPPAPCPKGTQQHQTGKNVCWSCSAGYYSDQIASLHCKACPKGHWCDKNNTGKPPTPCPKGEYQDELAKHFCWKCPAGTYTATTGATHCTSVTEIDE